MKKYNHRLPIWLQAIGVLILLAVFTFAVFIYNSTRDSEVLIILISSLFIVTLCIGSFLFLSQSISIAEKVYLLNIFQYIKSLSLLMKSPKLKFCRLSPPSKMLEGLASVKHRVK